MIKTLYPIFQGWSDKKGIFVISDTHFCDSDRKYMGYDISEEEQINEIKKICQGQCLIHLGDVGNTDYIKKLDCYKILIMGNHDQSTSKFKKQNEIIDLDNYSVKEINRLERTGQIDYVEYDFHKPFVRGYKSNNLFDEVYSGPLWISEKLVLSHEPICIESGVTRKPIAFNIHGHDHSGEYYNDDYHLNICQNVFGYKPLNLKKFIEDGFLKQINSVHRETIDHATKRKKERIDY